jgi:hypothetical protein
MVGIPTSRGCTNCRRRKKGCTLERPSCASCLKIGVPCSYEPPSNRLSRWTVYIPNGRAQYAHPVPSSPGLVQGALRTGLEHAFWNAYLPVEVLPLMPGCAATTRDWQIAIREMATENKLVQLALLSLALTVMGRIERNRVLLAEGMRLYTYSMRRLQALLQEQQIISLVGEDALLAVCELFSLYEMFRADEMEHQSYQATAWKAHVTGALHLLQLRTTPAASSTSIGLITYAQACAVYAAGVCREVPVIASRMDMCSAPTLRDELYKILLDVPELLGRMHHFRVRAHRHGLERYRLVDEGSQLLKDTLAISQELHAWESKVLDVYLQTGDGGDTALTITRPSLSQICRHRGYDFFSMVMHYWASIVPLYVNLAHLENYMNSLKVEVDDRTRTCFAPSVPTRDPYPYAMNLAEHMGHFLAPEAGLWGSQQAVIPLASALYYFAAYETFDLRSGQSLVQSVIAQRLASFTAEFTRSVMSLASPHAQGNLGDANELRRTALAWYGSWSEAK